MKLKKIVFCVSCILLWLGVTHAQENTTTTGGEDIGTGGTVSFSIGQVLYTTIIGSNGSIAQGVQQTFEISEVLGVEETTINLEMSVYPNPTSNYLTLKVEDTSHLSYQLMDILGRVIEVEKINKNSTSVKMEGLPSAAYLLRVKKHNKTIKIFKVIKK